MLYGITVRFQTLSRSEGQVAHALLTRPPLSHIKFHSEEIYYQASFDLHVLGTPPAFVLSQDQTLKTILLNQASLPALIISRTFCSFEHQFAITALYLLDTSTDKTLLNLIGFLFLVVV